MRLSVRRLVATSIALIAALIAVLAVAAPAATAGTASPPVAWQATASHLTPSVTSAYYYQDVTYSVRVVNTAHPAVVPTGTVTFQVDTASGWVSQGTRTLSAGRAHITLENFNYPVPVMDVRAHYNGGPHLTRSTSNVVEVNSKLIPTKLLLSPATIHHGQAIYVQAAPNPGLAGFHPPLDGLPGVFTVMRGTHALNYVYTGADFEGLWYKARITTVLSVGIHRITVDFSPLNSAAAFDVYRSSPTRTFTVKVLP